MNIHIVEGKGYGRTELGAFDAALNSAGICNYNLIYLSSVIPPGTTVIQHDTALPAELRAGTWGDRLYVVIAEHRTAKKGAEVWAGVGWVYDEVEKKGLFVEHHGSSKKQVEDDITNSLRDLEDNRGLSLSKVYMRVAGVVCEDKPVSVLVAAAYQVSDWHNKSTQLG